MDNSHKTAITRKFLSAPMRYLNDQDLLAGRCLDYGCGKGFDADTLNIDGFDPYHRPTEPIGKFDTITCNYVLNVIPNEDERQAVVDSVRSLLADGGKAYISVRNDRVELQGWTKRGTWQGLVYLDLPIVKSSPRFRMYLIEG